MQIVFQNNFKRLIAAHGRQPFELGFFIVNRIPRIHEIAHAHAVKIKSKHAFAIIASAVCGTFVCIHVQRFIPPFSRDIAAMPAIHKIHRVRKVFTRNALAVIQVV